MRRGNIVMPTYKKMLFIRSRFEFFRRIQTNEYRTGESNYNIPTGELHNRGSSVSRFSYIVSRNENIGTLLSCYDHKNFIFRFSVKGILGIEKKKSIGDMAPVICNVDSMAKLNEWPKHFMTSPKPGFTLLT